MISKTHKTVVQTPALVTGHQSLVTILRHWSLVTGHWTARSPVTGHSPRHWSLFLLVAGCLLASGCATPQYAIRPAPQPEESSWALEIERTISAYQAQELERQGVQPIAPNERLFGFNVQQIVNNLSRVTERPALHYRALLLRDKDPNAAALADGRIYVTTGMLQYLASRGSNEHELAFILGHELAHTVAQHLVKRYRELQKQQTMLALVGLGTAVITRGAGAKAQQLGALAQDVASLVQQVAASGYSQDQELEADQLGVRYCQRAGYDPMAGLAMLEDFKRFEQPGGFLRSHPYTERRLEDLRRYLVESGAGMVPTGQLTAPRLATPPAVIHSGLPGFPGAAPVPMAPPPAAAAKGRSAQRAGLLEPAAGGGVAPPRRRSTPDARQRLLDAQQLYPIGSQSWKNIQKQLDEIE